VLPSSHFKVTVAPPCQPALFPAEAVVPVPAHPEVQSRVNVAVEALASETDVAMAIAKARATVVSSVYLDIIFGLLGKRQIDIKTIIRGTQYIQNRNTEA
jgi:hypothetical protein